MPLSCFLFCKNKFPNRKIQTHLSTSDLYIYSKQPSKLLSPILRQHTAITFFNTKHPACSGFFFFFFIVTLLMPLSCFLFWKNRNSLTGRFKRTFLLLDLLIDRQYGFRKGRLTFSVALDISKASGTSLLSKLLPSGLYSSRYSFISSFLSGRTISAVVDGYCFTPKPINSSVPLASVLSPTLFLLFITDLSLTNCPIDTFTLRYTSTKDPPYRTYRALDWRQH